MQRYSAQPEPDCQLSCVFPCAISRDSWDFRKLCREGSVMTYGLVVADVDRDGTLEYIVGTTEGHLIVVKPDRREPLHRHILTATISVVLHASTDRLVLITLEGQCEVTEDFSTVLGVSSSSSAQAKHCRQFTVAANCTCGDMLDDRLFLGSSDRRVYIYSIRTGQLLTTTFLYSQIFSLRHFVLGERSLLMVATTTHLVLHTAEVQGPPGCWTTMVLDGISGDNAAAALCSIDDDDAKASFVQSTTPLWSWKLQREATNGETIVECGGGASYDRAGGGGFGGSDRMMMHPTRQNPDSHTSSDPTASKKKNNVRLPVGVDCFVRGPCATIVAASEDGYCWMFTLWIRGLATLGDSDGQLLEPLSPLSKHPLMLRQTWKSPLLLPKGLIPSVCLGRLIEAEDVGAFLLAPDGTLVVVNSLRQAVISKVRHDVSAFCLADNRAGDVVLVCLADDELVEFTVPCNEIGGVSVVATSSADLSYPVAAASTLTLASPSHSPATEHPFSVLEKTSDFLEGEALLMDVGRRLFGFNGLDDATIRRKIVALCHDGYTAEEWEELRLLAETDTTVQPEMET